MQSKALQYGGLGSGATRLNQVSSGSDKKINALRTSFTSSYPVLLLAEHRKGVRKAQYPLALQAEVPCTYPTAILVEYQRVCIKDVG